MCYPLTIVKKCCYSQSAMTNIKARSFKYTKNLVILFYQEYD